MNNWPVTYSSFSPPAPSMGMRVIYTTGCLFELTKWIAFLVVFFGLIHFFVATIFIVDGISMEPNFHTGEYVIADRWHYVFGEPQRGDSVILKFPGDPEHKKYIKRIVGLPGDKVQVYNGSIYINGQKLMESYIPEDVETDADRTVNETLKEDEYFVSGDNRPNSNDSRAWGAAPKRFLIGKAWFKVFPKPEKIPNVSYQLNS